MVTYKVAKTLEDVKKRMGKEFMSGFVAVKYAKQHELRVYRKLKSDERGWHLFWKK